MSWHFLQGQEEDCKQADTLDGTPFAPSKSMSTPNKSYSKDKETPYFLSSPFGMTSAPLTEKSGEEELTSSREDFLVNIFLQQAEDVKPPLTYGLKWQELFLKLGHGTSFVKMFQKVQSSKPDLISGVKAILSDTQRCQRKTWVQTILGKDGGFLHTPTTKANYQSKSMQKWQCCRNFVRVFGKAHPENQEWLMGWPEGWTDLEPLGMDKCLLFSSKHGKF